MVISEHWTEQFSNISMPLTDTQRAWLTYDGSLTQRLRDTFPDDISFSVSFNDWHSASAQEQALLKLSNDQTWLRHILWSFKGRPWVYGHTLIPKPTLDKKLQTLNDNSVATVLFGDNPCPRTVFSFCETRDAKDQPTISRRSIFHYNHKPLLITETFTADFLHDINS